MRAPGWAVAEAARNLSCVGAEPLAVTDNLNFPSPETPEGYWMLAMACRGLAEACRVMGTPVTGGNVSLYNETRDQHGRPFPIQPTPVVGMVGLVDDFRYTVGMGWPTAGEEIWMLGVPLDSVDERVSLAASTYLAVVHGLSTGRPPRLDLALETAVQGLLRQLIRSDVVTAAHDASEGGWLVALAESCITSGYGASIALDLPAGPGSALRHDAFLFAEGGSRVLVSVPGGGRQRLQEDALQAAVPCQYLGSVSHEPRLRLTVEGREWISSPLHRLQAVYSRAIPRRLQR